MTRPRAGLPRVWFPAGIRVIFVLLNAQTGSGARPAWVLGIKRPERLSDPSPLSTSKVNNEWRYTDTPLIRLNGTYVDNFKSSPFTDSYVFAQHFKNTWPLDTAGEGAMICRNARRYWQSDTASVTEELNLRLYVVSFPDTFESEWWCLKFMSVRSSVSIERLDFHQMDFHEISFLGGGGFFTEIGRRILIFLKIWQKNERHFTWGPTHVCVICLYNGSRWCSLWGSFWGLRTSWFKYSSLYERNRVSKIICRPLRDEHWQPSWFGRNTAEQKRPKK